MAEKSRFLSPLRTRDDLNYPRPGAWMRNVSFNKLATLAKNLDTSKSKDHPDKLHSIPTPWARLLLFESALYDRDHPAHFEVRSQWRGLLGLLGLADVLGLGGRLSVKAFRMRGERDGDLKNAFVSLRPRHVSGDRDEEDGKWDEFSLIYFGNSLLGSTSPRTVVFTGVAHRCPEEIPFRSPQGRLADPADHYKLMRDDDYLSALRQWIDHLIASVSNSTALASWLGMRPSDPNAQPQPRQAQLLDALYAWRDDVPSDSQAVSILMAGHSRLPGRFDFVRHIENIGDGLGKSDLFMRGHDDVIVCYRPKQNSVLLDAHGNPEGGTVRLYRGRQISPGEPLPDSTNFFPEGVRVLNNPAELFEDALIEIDVIDRKVVTCLALGNKNYLLPLRPTVAEFFSEAELSELARSAKIHQQDAGTIRVEIRIPLVKGRSVRAHKDYRVEHDVVSNDKFEHPTQQLAMWPDFVCDGHDATGRPFFEHYFYYTNDERGAQVKAQVEFTPMSSDVLVRGIPEKGHKWFLSNRPLPGFVGAVGDSHGLLLINHNPVPQPSRYWKVGVDFGSTHTSVFYREVEPRDGGGWKGAADAEVEPLHIRPRVKILTQGDAGRIQENFFKYGGRASDAIPTEAVITTQLSSPINRPEYFTDSWLPREGQVFLGSLLDGIVNDLKTDLKWNAETIDHSTSAFLRSLVMMIEAEAVHRGATIVGVAHAYPTAFPAVLRIKQVAEWGAVQRVVNVRIDPEPLSEAVAVCRHLWAEQRALPKAKMVAVDIGGSTSDIAIWSDETMQVQESVKMAAGSASRHVESNGPEVANYRSWFVKTLSQNEPFMRHPFFPPNFSPDKLKRRVYHAALKRLSEIEPEGGQGGSLMESFISTVKAAARSNGDVSFFLSPIVFLFAAIPYYAGLLTRKAKITGSGGYYMYFCGKGGQLLRWLPDGETLVKQMYAAGLAGPSSGAAAPPVSVHISRFPKEEVGRGVLIERHFKDVQDQPVRGMFAEAGATVTVAESGYDGLVWDGELTYDDLNRIKDNLPPVSSLAELNHFVDVLASSPLTQGVEQRLGLRETIEDDTYISTLRQRLSDNLHEGEGSALIEPLFITEAKVLLEITTGQDNLFD